MAGANSSSWDNAGLRDLRRRDFPPYTHPTIDANRPVNPCSERLAKGLATDVFPYVERTLLGLPSTSRITRCLLGASYSATVALQVLYWQPTAIDAYILGSPSTPFDPEFVDWLSKAEDATCASKGAFICYGAYESEPPAPADQKPTPGKPFTSDYRNVHRYIPDASSTLAKVLRTVKGMEVNGPHSIEAEDHTSLKLSLVSRGLGWLLTWWLQQTKADGPKVVDVAEAAPPSEEPKKQSGTQPIISHAELMANGWPDDDGRPRCWSCGAVSSMPLAMQLTRPCAGCGEPPKWYT